VSDLKSYRRWFWQTLLLVILGAVYGVTVHQDAGMTGDSAKFQFVGYVLGTPHPTGYPTYLTINHFFTTLFPFGSVAFRANLLSALFSLVMVQVLFQLLTLLEISPLVAFATCLTFGFTRTLWSQSIVAEVYSLNALFVSTVLYFFLRWEKTGKNVFLLLGCAVYAISFGHHLTMVTLLPAITMLVVVKDRSRFVDMKTVLPVLFFIAIGALQYAYVFWRTADPTTPYLEMRAPDFPSFWYEVTGAKFRSLMFHFTATEVVQDRIPMFLKLLLREYSFLIPVGLLGIFKLEGKIRNAFLLLCLLGSVTFAINYGIQDVDVYFIPAYLIFAIYSATGLEYLVKRVSWWPSALTLLIPVVFLVIGAMGVKDKPWHKEELGEVRSMLNVTDHDALVIPSGYREAQYCWYYLLVERYQEKNIFVTAHDIRPEAVRQYLLERRPYFSRYLQKAVPDGLAVYCMGKREAEDLSNAGLHLRMVGPQLYRVTE